MFPDYYACEILYINTFMNTTQYVCAMQWTFNKCMLLLTWLPSSLDTSRLKTNSIYILIGVAVVFLLCLLLFLLFCLHSHRQKKHGLPNSKSQEHSLQKRLSLVTKGLESTPDIVTDDLLPEDKRTETLIPDAGGLQEVTYAQLDHHALTQRTVGDVTPWSTETMTESSTYAAIIRR
ncbi:leukocyte-associated immunoglobulin-like receptor 1 [Microtus ochrogaster]|uniref:Leukocyte-associated immunoglobulin-like receptor 1 n=1 Tax=Microtus ochrogaster TaxID=79684 RepID=A0ABM1TWH8_MICOH|nr:leukocyte-associated immunoglobulin-like receptor 1 [Microtus ochrogaster]